MCRGCWGERKKGDWQACGKNNREEKSKLAVDGGMQATWKI